MQANVCVAPVLTIQKFAVEVCWKSTFIAVWTKLIGYGDLENMEIYTKN